MQANYFQAFTIIIIIETKQKMTEAVQHIQLSNQIKALIQNFYQNLSKSELNFKVRTEIIPLLINLFFQSQNQLMKVSKSQKFLEQLQQSLRESEKQNVKDRKDQDLTKRKNNIKLLSETMHFSQSVPNMIRKSLSFCKLIEWYTKSTKRRQNCIYMFEVYRKCRDIKIKSLRWLSKYVKTEKIRKALLSFYRNGIKIKQQIDVTRSLHKLYVLKLNKYFCHFLRAINSDQQACYGKIMKSKLIMIQKGAKLIQFMVSKNLRQALKRMKAEGYQNNKWRKIWVNRIALKTKANFQTSFWRLANFYVNSKDYEFEEKEGPLKFPYEQSRIKKRFEEIENSWMGSRFQSEFFTKEQKVLIMWNQVQMIEKSIKLRYTIEAFSVLESFLYSRKSLSGENSFKRLGQEKDGKQPFKEEKEIQEKRGWFNIQQ